MIVVPERRRALIVLISKRRGSGLPIDVPGGYGLRPEIVVPRAHRRKARGNILRGWKKPGFGIAVAFFGAVMSMQVRDERHRTAVGRRVEAVHVAARDAS